VDWNERGEGADEMFSDTPTRKGGERTGGLAEANGSLTQGRGSGNATLNLNALKAISGNYSYKRNNRQKGEKKERNGKSTSIG